MMIGRINKITLAVGALLLTATAASAQTDSLKGTKMTSEHYVGEVYIKPLDRTGTYMTTKITFAPGSLNDWHIHPDAAQTMLVVEGQGYYQEEGKPRQLLRMGESVTTPANVKHWNGSTPTDPVTVITVSQIAGESHITWEGKVLDEIFNAPEPTGDMLVRISEIEVYPEYLDEYLKFALTVGATSIRKEPGVIAIYPMIQQRDSCQIRILEIYANQAAYQHHITTDHFQTYKQGTLHMVKSLDLVDMYPMNPSAMPDIFRKLTMKRDE